MPKAGVFNNGELAGIVEKTASDHYVWKIR